MTHTTEAEIRAILANMLADREVDVAALPNDAPIVLTLALDSLDAVDLAMELKRHFSVDVTESDTFDTTLEALAVLVDERRPRP